MGKEKGDLSVGNLTRLCSVEHEPADGDVAVPQAVEEFGDVVQDDLLPQESRSEEHTSELQ